MTPNKQDGFFRRNLTITACQDKIRNEQKEQFIYVVFVDFDAALYEAHRYWILFNFVKTRIPCKLTQDIASIPLENFVTVQDGVADLDEPLIYQPLTPCYK